ncbi:MND1-interacting protein 1 [Heracleum sosnowskyi]|uniref:MND1-interacting protein 1 n=1 Tax=Heracleum sosnowskyi TaxID=360622 RepID=A0AAD8HY28_9APIA|nr:MND1-interacting protein 1 [Heracleum sosnowskyi]
MGCTVREKHIRANRKPRAVKSDVDHSLKSGLNESGSRLFNYHPGCNNNESGQNPNSHFDDSGWGYCTEEQLEEILLKNLEFLYSEAISKLVALGYEEDVALKAILKNGHCYGGMDVLTNILHNALTYLNNGCSNGNTTDGVGVGGEVEPVFVDLRQLEEYSLAGMVCLLQQVKPHLSKGDAMWCLLMSDLHVGRASVMDFPCLPSHGNDGGGCGSTPAPSNVENVGNYPVGVAPALCRFHGGWGFGTGGTSEFPMNGLFSYASEMTLQREIECPKRFNLTPSMKNLLKRNVAAFAAGFRANSKELQTQANGDGKPATGAKTTGTEVQNEESQDAKSQDVIKDLERQVKERKEWAHQKAMQAARKLSHDLTELKMLRMEREENQRLKKGKQTLEDSTMKRLSEMENALRKASGQVDRANAAVRRLETENAEIRAEMEASKLSASESVTTCLEVAKREKKGLKRLLAWEKQKAKFQEDIAAEKQNILELEAQLLGVEAAQKEAEEKWKQALKAKEAALTQLEAERRLKEADEASHKRGHEALRLKIEIDFQRHKDDLQRLEQELARLKLSTEINHQSNNLPVVNTEGTEHQEETIASMLNELDNHESSENGGSDRKCFFCVKEEVSVVFLPCAHQVLCSDCSDNYGKKGKALCPCCRVPIEQRIRVFGAGSS